MKIMDIITIGVMVLAIVVGVASTKVFKQKDDNQIEEAAEDVIEKLAGVDVDLTPSSKEEK